MRTFYRRVFGVLMLVLLVAPSVTLAQTSKISEFNSLCWTDAQCTTARAEALGLTPDVADQLPSGWVKDPRECPGEKWGKCLPAGVSQTQVAFGGRDSFLHLGDFIQYMYRYAIGVAGILAALMIIVAGFQWASSGGNAEAVGSAKQRITGAVIGLIIAYLSYAILNTINPALVNLRLPQVWMVRPQSLVPTFCSAAPANTIFAFAADTKDQESLVDLKTHPPDFEKNGLTAVQVTTTDKGYCGHRFFMQDGGSATCYGSFCGQEGMTCSNINLKDPNDRTYKCRDGVIFGRVTASRFIEPICGLVAGYVFPYLKTSYKDGTVGGIVGLCEYSDGVVDIAQENKGRGEITVGRGYTEAVSDASTKVQFYKISRFKPSELRCKDGGKMLGYALYVDVNRNCNTSDGHLLDKNGGDINKGVDISDYKSDISKIKNSIKSANLFQASDFEGGIILDFNVADLQVQ